MDQSLGGAATRWEGAMGKEGANAGLRGGCVWVGEAAWKLGSSSEPPESSRVSCARMRVCFLEKPLVYLCVSAREAEAMHSQ
eukprot:scaffold147048_cov23-Tisochrysis_lutea.AAC.1